MSWLKTNRLFRVGRLTGTIEDSSYADLNNDYFASKIFVFRDVFGLRYELFLKLRELASGPRLNQFNKICCTYDSWYSNGELAFRLFNSLILDSSDFDGPFVFFNTYSRGDEAFHCTLIIDCFSDALRQLLNTPYVLGGVRQSSDFFLSRPAKILTAKVASLFVDGSFPNLFDFSIPLSYGIHALRAISHDGRIVDNECYPEFDRRVYDKYGNPWALMRTTDKMLSLLADYLPKTDKIEDLDGGNLIKQYPFSQPFSCFYIPARLDSQTLEQVTPQEVASYGEFSSILNMKRLVIRGPTISFNLPFIAVCGLLNRSSVKVVVHFESLQQCDLKCSSTMCRSNLIDFKISKPVFDFICSSNRSKPFKLIISSDSHILILLHLLIRHGSGSFGRTTSVV